MKSKESQEQTSKSPLPVESDTWLHPPATNVTTHVKCCLLEKLIRDPVPRVVVGGWSHRYSAEHVPNSRLTEGKQVLSINHVLCPKSVGTESHSH